MANDQSGLRKRYLRAFIQASDEFRQRYGTQAVIGRPRAYRISQGLLTTVEWRRMAGQPFVMPKVDLVIATREVEGKTERMARYQKDIRRLLGAGCRKETQPLLHFVVPTGDDRHLLWRAISAERKPARERDFGEEIPLVTEADDPTAGRPTLALPDAEESFTVPTAEEKPAPPPRRDDADVLKPDTGDLDSIGARALSPSLQRLLETFDDDVGPLIRYLEELDGQVFQPGFSRVELRELLESTVRPRIQGILRKLETARMGPAARRKRDELREKLARLQKEVDACIIAANRSDQLGSGGPLDLAVAHIIEASIDVKSYRTELSAPPGGDGDDDDPWGGLKLR